MSKHSKAHYVADEIASFAAPLLLRGAQRTFDGTLGEEGGCVQGCCVVHIWHLIRTLGEEGGCVQGALMRA